MRATMQVIVAACRRALGNAPGDDFAALVSSVADWPALVRGVDAHGVASIVYAPLAQTGRVPRDPLSQLRAAVDENALRSIVLARALREIVDLLEQNHVPVIPIKGPLLARSAYGDLASRRFADLDLVVHRRDLDRARAILAQRGFEPAIPLAPDAEAAVLGADYHVALVERAQNVMLELHWALDRAGLAGLRDDAWPWMHCGETTALGAPMQTLTSDATFMYLCVHGAKHRWSQLSWLCDLAALSRTSSASWPAVERLAASVGATRMVMLGCALADELLGASLSGWPGQRDAHVTRLASDVRACLFNDAPTMSLPTFELRVRTRLADRITYLAQIAAGPRVPDVRLAVLPHGARALYYVLRPARLVAKYGRRALGR